MGCDKEMICGDCGNFDEYVVPGVHEKKRTLTSGDVVQEGYCRTRKGLVEVGVVHNQLPCRREPPEEFFNPREQVPVAA